MAMATAYRRKVGTFFIAFFPVAFLIAFRSRPRFLASASARTTRFTSATMTFATLRCLGTFRSRPRFLASATTLATRFAVANVRRRRNTSAMT
jgi:hypothetical protein